MPVNWNLGLMNPTDVGKQFQEGMKQGDEMRRQRAVRRYAANPDDAEAQRDLMASDPETAMRLMRFRGEQQERERDSRFRDAASRYVTPQMGALSGYAPQTIRADGPPSNAYGPPAGGAVNALTGMAPGVSGQSAAGVSALAPFALTQTPPAAPSPGIPAPPVPSLPTSRQPDDDPHAQLTGILGQPETDADHAFLEMLQADPVKALEMRSTMRDRTVKMLKAEHDAYDMAISQLGAVTDDASYQAVLGQFAQRFDALGIDVRGRVPANYPGPDGIRKLLQSSLSAKEQLDQLLNREKLDAHLADMDADNERADRNTDSLIADRTARRSETRRFHDQRDATTRRGQDRPRGGGKRTSARPTATGPNGEKMQFDGKAWVPVK